MLFFILFNKHIILGISVLPVGFQFNYGFMYPVFVAYDIALTLGAIGILAHKYFSLTGKEKNKVKFFILGIALGMGLGAICNAIIPVLFHTSKLSSIGPIFTIFISIFTAYAIVTQRLMGIEVIIKKGTVYGILAGAFTGIYTLILLSFQALFDADHHVAVTILTSVIMAVGFRPLHDWLEAVTDKVFYRKRPNYNNILKDFADNLSSILELKDLAAFAIASLVEGLKLERASFFALDNQEITYYELSDNKPVAKKKRDFRTQKLMEYSQQMPKDHQVFVYDELDSMKLSTELKQAIKQEMEYSNSKVVIPIVSNAGKVFGLALGQKLSEDMFTNEDINTLMIIAKQISIALETIKLHEEVIENQKTICHANNMATIGRLTQGIAHEIKNPMYAIETYFDVLPDNPKDSPEKKNFIQSTKESIKRIQSLAENLGQFSRRQAVLISVNINEVIREEINAHILEFKEQNIVVDQKFSEMPILKLDPHFVKQTLANIIINARQAMPNGGKLIISTSLSTNNDQILISIKDTGQGISPEAIPNIFEPRVSTKEKGSGLGLALSADMINTLGGTITVESELGHGSVFTISLPIS